MQAHTHAMRAWTHRQHKPWGRWGGETGRETGRGDVRRGVKPNDAYHLCFYCSENALVFFHDWRANRVWGEGDGRSLYGERRGKGLERGAEDKTSELGREGEL